jgi:hypothetical protein
MPYHIGRDRARQIADLAIEVERMRNTIARLAADVETLDATIERLSRDRARGMTRNALSILRRHGKPMRLRDVTVALMTERGMDTGDFRAVNREMEKLRVLLTRQRAHGIVRREEGPTWAALWSITT